ncbi:MAG: hypothetical protein H7345_07795 [Rubritepida sp.]|nr:hypothetical protein [Rubritepida sp.]
MSDIWNDEIDNEGFSASLSLTPGARYFDNIGSAFRSLDLGTAADNLARYRSGRGGTHVFTNQEIERHAPLLRYEDENRTAFKSYSFVGETSRGIPTGTLQNLPDGESVAYGDTSTLRKSRTDSQRTWPLDALASFQGSKAPRPGVVTR